ncbi:hypothetical protein BGZ65_012895 [Modicella reniformis]|uniref:Uncharacterized protein n=1 Tax=Modicella reniformis TaxID=1440133 RepID=A0A9P6SP84_9FUNG|nr:hypothetical protein BGZ65_012895 [Modicella reniformis]
MIHVQGSQSEPISPISPIASSSPSSSSSVNSSLLIPIFPAPTKYHFRSHDNRRRASFPKSANHPNRANLNVNRDSAGNLITTTAAGSLSEETTTTFIKVQAHDPSSHLASGKNSSAKFHPQQYGGSHNHEGVAIDFSDEYVFDDCCKDHHDDDDDEYDDEDEDDEFNGVARSHRYRFSTKDAIVARRAQADDTRKAAPGMLWQVYTAVTGVKELIAWYGSMVYHSSSL